MLTHFPSATLKETKQAPEVVSEHYTVTETPYSLLALVYHGWYHCHTPKEYPNNSTLICNPLTRTIARMIPEHLVIHHCATIKMFWTILMFYVRFDVLEEILLDHINPQIEIEPLEPEFFNLLYNPKG